MDSLGIKSNEIKSDNIFSSIHQTHLDSSYANSSTRLTLLDSSGEFSNISANSSGLIRVKFNSLTLLTPLDLLGGFSNISTNSTHLDSSGGKTQLTSLDSLLLTHFSSTRITHLDSLGRQTNEINSFDLFIDYQSNSPGLIRVKINSYTLLTHMDSAV